MLMKTIISTVLLVLSPVVHVGKDCSCSPATTTEATHWVGNLQMVFRERKPYRQLRGTIVRPDGKPLPRALVEVFTNPEYLFDERVLSKRDAPKQRRVAACVTGADGEFCFSGLPAGRYEIRSSSEDTRTGWNVSQVYVILNPKSRRKQPLTIQMTLGI